MRIAGTLGEAYSSHVEGASPQSDDLMSQDVLGSRLKL